MKLNLGCGNDVRPGYVNVDFRKTHHSVTVVDLSAFPWPFDDGSADEILMLDFLEHFPFKDTGRILLECHRILSSEGELVVQVPDASHVCRALLQIDRYLCNRCSTPIVVKEDDHGNLPCVSCGQTRDWTSEEAMRRLFGGQDYPGNFHQTCFTMESLRWKLEEAGFESVTPEEEEHQYVNWNVKVRSRKGDVWGSP